MEWRYTLPAKRKPIRKVSKAGRARMAEYKKTRDSYLKEHATLIDGEPWIQCQAPGCKEWTGINEITIHHSRGRIGSLLCDARHFVAVCLTCHRAIGEKPEWARSVGLLCQKGLWNTPDRT